MNISVVIPLFNEEESLPELCEWIDKVMISNSYSYEIILIDDGSKDRSWNVIEQLSTINKNIRGNRMRFNFAIQLKSFQNLGHFVDVVESALMSSGDVVIVVVAVLVLGIVNQASGVRGCLHILA